MMRCGFIRRRRAAVLVLVLWAIAMLSLIAGGLSFELRQELALARLADERLVAHLCARAGVERAIAELMDDTDLGVDRLDETWADNEPEFRDVPVGGGTFTVLRDDYEPVPTAWYGAGDESAKLNINAAPREALAKLPNMTETVVGAILDWRDRDEQAEPDGIERGYYGALPHPYDIRNAPFRTTRELLLVRGVTPELFYGEDTNANGLLDENENDGDRTDPPDNADGRLDRGWLAYVTAHSHERNVNAAGDKRLNLNSASADDLALRLSLETWAAESIVRHRQRNRFEHLVDLLNVQRDPEVPRDPTEMDMYQRSPEEQDRPVTRGIFEEIVNELTLKDEETLPGRVNLNTAPREVLEALPGVTPELADAILRQRTALGGFETIGQLLRINALSTETFGQLEEHVTVRSSVFRIRSRGVAESQLASATIECVVDRGEDVPRILYWSESTP